MADPPRPTRPDPASCFGFTPGDEHRLVRWRDMLTYFQTLAGESDRLDYEQIGTVSGGEPLVLLTISTPENLARREEFQAIQRRLADPRTLPERDAEHLIAEGRAIVLLTCSIHAIEVGSAQMTPELVYELVTRQDPHVAAILENVILLLIPSLNPWGMNFVHDWYEETLGTPSEGTPPPGIYHPYTGHDNNRDWFMLSQIENRLTVEKVHNIWHPHIVFDQHQMMTDGPRFVLPPYIDPYDPNVDPILQAEIAQLGTSIAAELVANGKDGIATQVIFDAYSPSRAYQHYHGGVRLLSEAASCAIATTTHLEQSEIREIRGFDPLRRQANNPRPWTGGDWRLRDIVDYNKAAAWACLRHAATYREHWVRNFYRVQKNSTCRQEPFAFVVPFDQPDPGAVRDLLGVLKRGLVEIQEADACFEAGGVAYPAGTRIVKLGQPFGPFAKTLLEVQDYPLPRNARNTPYDITSHCLPLYLGVEAVEINEPFEAVLRELSLEDLEPPPGHVDAHRGHGWAIDPRQNCSAQAVNRLLEAGATIHRTADEFIDGSNTWPAGTFIVDPDGIEDMASMTSMPGAVAVALESSPTAAMQRLRQPRIGLYRSWCPNAMDEGWTRFVLETYEFACTTLRDQEIRQGNLQQRFDVIILPHQSAEEIILGNSAADYPHEFAGGIGERGAANLRRFAESGGTLITLDGASEVAMRHLYLPVINPIETLSEQQFYCPGATLQMLVDPKHPIAYGFEREVAGLVTGRHAFSPITEHEVGQVARYPANNQLLSGWIQGANYIRGMASLIDVPVQDGRAILFGFRPQFRAQTRGTYRLLFNAIYYGALS
jgi:hypothetical protein